MDISQYGSARKPGQANARVMPARRAQLVSGYASRLAAIRAQISFLHAAPASFGGGAAQRSRRDEYILQALAADIHARMIEARSA